MADTHFSGPLYVGGQQLTDADGNLIAAVEMSDLDQIVDENGNELLEFDSNASAVNHIVVENSTTGVNPIIYAGGEADTGITFENSESEPILVLDAVASSTVYLQIQNATTGVAPIISSEGEADIGIQFHNDQGEEMLVLASGTTAVTYVQIASSATGVNPIISAQGEADTGLEFHNDQAEPMLVLEPTASATTYVGIQSNTTGLSPIIQALGEADLGLQFHNDQAEVMFAMDAVATGVNYMQAANAATGAAPVLSIQGEADIGLEIHNDQGEQSLIIASAATAVNEFTISPAAAGAGPQLEATGDDTDVNIELIPKGAGYVDVQNGGIQVVAQSVTPNNDNGTASTIEDGAIHVDVGAVTNDANDWVTLPSLASVPVGHTITIACNAGTNFELRTPTTSNEKINNVDSDGTAELLMTDTEVVVIRKVSDTDGWTATSHPLAGGVGAAVTPDA